MQRTIYWVQTLLIVCAFSVGPTFAQTKGGNKELKVNLNEDGSHYLKATVTAQIWARYNQSNTGTTVFGYNKPETFDIGLRRVRTQLYGKITDKVFFYSQFGINNFTYNSARKPSLFFHDVILEYQFTPRAFQAGMGLTAWTGFSRFSSPAIASILGYDAPLYQQTTNDVNDQFLRKLSIYAKGKISKLDYRVVLTTPMAVQNTGSVKPLNANSDFSYRPAKLQSSAYFMWQFLDEESNMMPYMTANYLGKKRVFNIGAGYQIQPKAMWHLADSTNGTTTIVEEDMLNYNVDLYYDAPVGSKGSAISAYAAYTHLGFGTNYLRNLGPMNPADAASKTSLGGGGNSVPLFGTGNIMYAQVGYLLPKELLGKNNGQLQAYLMLMHANYERLNSPMQVVDAGLNYFLDGHRAKLTLDFQNRPVFGISDAKVSSRKNAVILQFQIAI